MKDEVYFDPTKKVIVVNGKKFVLNYEKKPEFKGHSGHLICKEQSSDYEERLDKAAQYLADKSTGLTIKAIIKEALRLQNNRELLRLERSMEKKVEPKVELGCIAFNVNGQIIGIVD